MTVGKAIPIISNLAIKVVLFMVIDVSQQLKEPIGSIRHYRVSETESNCSTYGEVSLLRTDRGIFVSGTLNTAVKALCGRCLVSFDQSLTLEIKEEYLLTVDPSTGASLPFGGEEGAFTINENREVDLTEAVRQYSLLALPMKPLCREGCAGLCPSCGQNLNLGPCSCPAGAIDPRLAGLARLASEERVG